MKTTLPATGIALALLLSACSSQDKSQGGGGGTATSTNGPTAEEVDAYLETKLPNHLDVDDVKTENFIDPNTLEGRVSVSATLLFKEATYRDATTPEILQYLQLHGISPSERQLYLPFNQYRPVDTDHRLLAVVSGPQMKLPITTEVVTKKTVDGWSFLGGRIVENLDQSLRVGQPLDAFGSGALPMGSPQAEAYLNAAAEQKSSTNSGEDTLLANVRTLFVPGRTIIIHMMNPQNTRMRNDVSFTPEGPIELSPDGKSTFTVLGAIKHSNLENTPYHADRATKARITGQLGHQQGTLTPNYVLSLDFFDPIENRFSGSNTISDAAIFDKRILSTNGLYYFNWWTD